MALHRIKKGLDLPIAGAPKQEIAQGAAVSRVALMGEDYQGLKPTMLLHVGDSVKRGQPLFTDKKTPSVIYTAPGAGKITAVNRGERRAFTSLVIDLTESERAGKPNSDDLLTFESYTGNDPAGLSRDEIKALLVESGLWTAFRTRPFSKVPDPASDPDAIFITAMDTNPLAPSLDEISKGNEDNIERGLLCLAKLREGHIYFCKAPGSAMTVGPYSGVSVEEFEGVHPSGTVGVHIHILDPVHREKTAWHIALQDVIAFGRLFTTGQYDVERIVSFAGPTVNNPRLLRTRIGAAIDELVQGELAEGENRVISGSVLSGRQSMGEIHGYLGRYHQQISVLREGREREFLGWMAPGRNKFSILNTFISKFTPKKKFSFTTTTHGSERAMVPIGSYERVMPMDVMPTFLLRSLLVGDIERAEHLGCLELDEEDLALCTFVCPGKYEYGPYLRWSLARIEKEG